MSCRQACVNPLLSIAPAKLRPTQMTVGKAEVAEKAGTVGKTREKEAQGIARRTLVPPVVLGPKNQVYIVDHHHLGLALFEEGVKECR